jgi:hypothetical protein
MAKWSFTSEGFTPVGVLDTAAFTDNGYMGIMGGSATQRIDIYEVSMAGLATVSAPTPMVLARDSTVQATPTALTTAQSNAALDLATAALAAPQVAFTASTTKPQRSATLAKLSLGFNAFGGTSRWQCYPGQEFKMLGNAANGGEASLSSYTGGTPGLMTAHILYETF